MVLVVVEFELGIEVMVNTRGIVEMVGLEGG
jgi:hypothetical protein